MWAADALFLCGSWASCNLPDRPCAPMYAFLFKLAGHWLELYKLYYASYLCRGIGQTPCSFEHVSCFTKETLKPMNVKEFDNLFPGSWLAICPFFVPLHNCEFCFFQSKVLNYVRLSAFRPRSPKRPPRLPDHKRKRISSKTEMRMAQPTTQYTVVWPGGVIIIL